MNPVPDVQMSPHLMALRCFYLIGLHLLRLAVILFDCYRSHDLVLYLLREHDRRTKLGYGEKFFELVRRLVNVPEAG